MEVLCKMFPIPQKASSCISHTITNSKIKALPLEWFENYFTDRKQIIQLKQFSNDVKEVKGSTPKLITIGVPQGSVLRAILFTGDLQKYLKIFCHSVMNAEDTVLEQVVAIKRRFRLISYFL